MCVLYRIIDLRHKPTIYVFFSISCAHIWAICGRLTFARYGSNVEHFQCHENSFKVRTYASSTQCKLLSRIYMLILCARIWVFLLWSLLISSCSDSVYLFVSKVTFIVVMRIVQKKEKKAKSTVFVHKFNLKYLVSSQPLGILLQIALFLA